MNRIQNNLEAKNWTPLHTRLVSHRIGDGGVNTYGHYTWDNKKPEKFIELAKKLDIKIWGPIQSDKWGTQKIIIHKKLFQKFGRITKSDEHGLLEDPVYLLEIIKELPKEHQLQTMLAILVDDGCCKNWMLILFEDQHKEIVEAVYELWNSLYPNTATIKVYLTKKKTKVYHIFVNRDGIIQLYEDLEKTTKKFGELAGIWWKSDALYKRYLKTISDSARKCNETKILRETRKNQVINNLKKQNSMTFRNIKYLLDLSDDRTRLIVKDLINEKRIVLIGKTKFSKYCLCQSH